MKIIDDQLKEKSISYSVCIPICDLVEVVFWIYGTKVEKSKIILKIGQLQHSVKKKTKKANAGDIDH